MSALILAGAWKGFHSSIRAVQSIPMRKLPRAHAASGFAYLCICSFFQRMIALSGEVRCLGRAKGL